MGDQYLKSDDAISRSALLSYLKCLIGGRWTPEQKLERRKLLDCIEREVKRMPSIQAAPSAPDNKLLDEINALAADFKAEYGFFNSYNQRVIDVLCELAKRSERGG